MKAFGGDGEITRGDRFRKVVELGIATADRGAVATEEEVRDIFARWGVKD